MSRTLLLVKVRSVKTTAQNSVHTLFCWLSQCSQMKMQIFSLHAAAATPATRLQLEIKDSLIFFITLFEFILCQCDSVELIILCWCAIME